MRSTVRRLAAVAGFVIACFWAAAGIAAPPQSRNVDLLSQMDLYAEYSACWSYVHHDGREYAILGTTTGTSIVRLTDPSNPVEVGFIGGPASDWREMKQYRNWVYVCTEGAGAGRGIQIINMSDPEDPKLARTYRSGFDTAHTVSIDTTRAILYCNGTSTGMVALALQPRPGATNASPTNPQEIGVFSDYYVHDLHLRGTLGYVSAINNGFESILDLTNPALLDAGAVSVEVKRWTTPAQFTHNSWTTKNGDYLIVTEENAGGKPKVYDISGSGTPLLKFTFADLPAHIGHNVHVVGDTAFVSYYTAGVRLYDITDPTKPVEFAYYDTFQGGDGAFDGVWEVAPYFPSGIFIASDISNGLFVFRTNASYGVVRGAVRDAPAGTPLAGVTVHDHTSEAETTTGSNGAYALAASANPAGEIEASRFGYETATATLNVMSGGSYVQDFVTPLLPSGGFRAEAKRASDQAALPNSPFELLGTPLTGIGGPAGGYLFQPVPVGTYTVKSERPGYLTGIGWGSVVEGQQTNVQLSLTRAPVYDDAETLGLWTLGAAGDDAVTGQWVQTVPTGTSTARVANGAPRTPFAPVARGFPLSAGQHEEPVEGTGAPGDVQPYADNTPAPGTICFVTGNGAGGGIGEADVDDGTTTLTSPTWNVSGIADPRLAYWRWYSNNAGSGAGEDPFITLLSNDGGANWTPVDSLFDTRNYWARVEWRLTDVFPSPADIRVRFVAQDLGAGSIVEAAVDDVMLFSGDLIVGVSGGTPAIAPAVVLGAPRPSPTRRGAEVSLTMPRSGPVFAAIHDVRGRLVRRLFVGTLREGTHRLRWDGATQGGADAAAGVYFVHVRAGGVAKRAKIVVVR